MNESNVNLVYHEYTVWFAQVSGPPSHQVRVKLNRECAGFNVTVMHVLLHKLGMCTALT